MLFHIGLPCRILACPSRMPPLPAPLAPSTPLPVLSITHSSTPPPFLLLLLSFTPPPCVNFSVSSADSVPQRYLLALPERGCFTVPVSVSLLPRLLTLTPPPPTPPSLTPTLWLSSMEAMRPSSTPSLVGTQIGVPTWAVQGGQNYMDGLTGHGYLIKDTSVPLSAPPCLAPGMMTGTNAFRFTTVLSRRTLFFGLRGWS